MSGRPAGGVAAPAANEKQPLTPAERRGLAFAGLAVLGMIALWALITVLPGSPFVDPDADPEQRFNPLYRSLVAFFAVTFFVAGGAMGPGSGAIQSHRDLVGMMRDGIAQLAPYIVLAFFAAHFVAMFKLVGAGADSGGSRGGRIEEHRPARPAAADLRGLRLLLLRPVHRIGLGRNGRPWRRSWCPCSCSWASRRR